MRRTEKLVWGHENADPDPGNRALRSGAICDSEGSSVYVLHPGAHKGFTSLDAVLLAKELSDRLREQYLKEIPLSPYSLCAW